MYRVAITLCAVHLNRPNVMLVVLHARAKCSAKACSSFVQQRKLFSTDKPKDDSFASFLKPVTVADYGSKDDIGAELTGVKKVDWPLESLRKILMQFYRSESVKDLANDEGMDPKLYKESFESFRSFIFKSDVLQPDLHVLLHDIITGSGRVEDLFPFFCEHAKKAFPHLRCIDDLRKLSDLTSPANWYPEARNRARKIIYHAGPTNSGKTHNALKRFTESSSGIYCGPLRLLANEVYHKTNDLGTPCDLVTGEERKLARTDGKPANHVACTVEMASVTNRYEVAVIDEIQMLRDDSRGWAWTRAFLGLNADEVHVCGEEAAVGLVQQLADDTLDDFEVRRYKRLTRLKVLSKGLDDIKSVQSGDAIVCFRKSDIYKVSQQLQSTGHSAAVIYGSLPAETKLAQAKLFNDTTNNTNVLVATDAIGMGLNLSIRRIVLYSLTKYVTNENGEREMRLIPSHQALQIAGRAGRFGTAYEEGMATTYNSDDLPQFKEILNRPIESLKKAGLLPTAEQIEQFHFLLPKAPLSALMDIFSKLSMVDDEKYFLCEIQGFKMLADMIEHVTLPIVTRYIFCCAPIKLNEPFICTMFVQFANHVGNGHPLTLDTLCELIEWPFKTPSTLKALAHLENVFDITDLYLWLGFRFPELYPDTAGVEMIQKRLNTLIQEGVVDLARLRKVEPADTTPADISSGGGRRRAPKGGASNADVAASETARMTANNIEFVDAAATLNDSGTSTVHTDSSRKLGVTAVKVKPSQGQASRLDSITNSRESGSTNASPSEQTIYVTRPQQTENLDNGFSHPRSRDFTRKSAVAVMREKSQSRRRSHPVIGSTDDAAVDGGHWSRRDNGDEKAMNLSVDDVIKRANDLIRLKAPPAPTRMLQRMRARPLVDDNGTRASNDVTPVKRCMRNSRDSTETSLKSHELFDDNHDLSDSGHCFTSDVISLKRLTRARKVRSMRVSLSETAVDGYYVLECGSDSWKIPADDVRRIELQLMSVMLAKLQKLPDAEIDAKYQLVKSMIRDVLRAVAKNKPLSEKLFIPVRKELARNIATKFAASREE